MQLTPEQLQRAKDRLIDELTSAIQTIIHEDWNTMKVRLEEAENIRKQLDGATITEVKA
jgi:phenylpyruvate tautomerase PptA (4-oxalocrotonate tautomerase family)